MYGFILEYLLIMVGSLLFHIFILVLVERMDGMKLRLIFIQKMVGPQLNVNKRKRRKHHEKQRHHINF